MTFKKVVLWKLYNININKTDNFINASVYNMFTFISCICRFNDK